MKKIFSILFISILFLSAENTFAQGYKFGHIDLQALLSVMPERAKAEKDFQAFAEELQAQSDNMQKEYTSKLQAFEADQDSLSDFMRQARIDEIQNLQQRIQQFQAMAQQQMQKKEQDMMAPIVQSARNAINEVAKEKGLLYVFESNSILYKSNESIDLLPLVKSKLGIQ